MQNISKLIIIFYLFLHQLFGKVNSSNTHIDAMLRIKMPFHLGTQTCNLELNAFEILCISGIYAILTKIFLMLKSDFIYLI